jgi:hypothetical protein
MHILTSIKGIYDTNIFIYHNYANLQFIQQQYDILERSKLFFNLSKLIITPDIKFLYL